MCPSPRRPSAAPAARTFVFQHLLLLLLCMRASSSITPGAPTSPLPHEKYGGEEHEERLVSSEGDDGGNFFPQDVGVRSSEWFAEVQTLDIITKPIINVAGQSHITVEFRENNHHLLIDLHPTSDLLAETYRKPENGTQEDPKRRQECAFQGTVRDLPGSWAALTLCDEVRGVVVVSGRELLVEPLPGTRTPEGPHRIVSREQVESVPGKCGVDTEHEGGETLTDIMSASHRVRRGALHGALWTDKLTRFVEVVIVADRSFYLKFRDKVDARCRAMVNIVNAMYRPLGVVVVLTDLIIWDDSDKITVTNRHVDLLGRFTAYRLKLLQERPDLPNDNTVLLTRVDFIGSTVGYATVKGMCSKNSSVSVVQDKNEAVGIVAQTLAHEMGHNLGMLHDEDAEYCTCESSKCVMGGTGSSVYNSSMGWSSCSKKYLAQSFSTAGFDCLKNVPTKLYSRPSCGNGVVEKGEQCDCGPAEFCDNPCCDADTCRLAENATCASGACCDTKTCKPLPTGSLCRDALSECDLPEFCAGDSEYCPADVFRRDGELCFDGMGHCHRGECGSHEQRCKIVWGPTTSKAGDRCYNYNTQGSSNGNCGFEDRGLNTLSKCSQRDSPCGTLHCLPATDKPMLTGSYRYGNIGKCHYVLASRHIPSAFWLVPDGSSCGVNKMCVKQKCKEIAEPDGVSQCPNGCSGHGVCNSNNNCHCDLGFGPPDCSGFGFGGSYDSGHMEEPRMNPVLKAIIIIFFLLLAIVIIFCCTFDFLRRWWEKRGRSRVRSSVPCCASCIDSCCCFFMAKFTHWVVSAGPLGKEKHAVQRQVEAKEGGDRTTICQVDVDFNKDLSKTNTWGVADDKLVTDIVTITPKNSPDLRRKVQLPSDSPVLYHKSHEGLDRPTYIQSLSVDSGCVVDDEEVITKEPVSSQMSMTSLVSALRKFNSKSPKTPDREAGQPKFPARKISKTPEREIQRPPYVTQKSMPLSRFVVDPLAGNRNSRQGTPPPFEEPTPNYRRSVSTDMVSACGTKTPEARPRPPPPALKPHKSEDNIHRAPTTRDNPFFPPDKVIGRPGRANGQGSSSENSSESLDGRLGQPTTPKKSFPARAAPPPPPPPGQKKPKHSPKLPMLPSGAKRPSPPAGHPRPGPPTPPSAAKPGNPPAAGGSVKDLIRRMETN
ncbi:disintegrin and metalloproteinase domain-containing protein 33-like [Penaeus indicus]|uniref:disintegrin and metalloproteinase domain-containing protein 33-like n=1 Tax=Penaeus indicus TaxID=29960 RepID=UPI00300CF685